RIRPWKFVAEKGLDNPTGTDASTQSRSEKQAQLLRLRIEMFAERLPQLPKLLSRRKRSAVFQHLFALVGDAEQDSFSPARPNKLNGQGKTVRSTCCR